MKKIIFFLILSFIPTVQAQLIDTISSLGVQGSLTTESVKSVSQGMKQLNKIKIIQDLSAIVTEIRINNINGYKNLTQPTGHYFSGLDYSVTSDKNNEFYIKINNLDKSTCEYLSNSYSGYKSLYINNSIKNSNLCKENNTLKFVFE